MLTFHGGATFLPDRIIEINITFYFCYTCLKYMYCGHLKNWKNKTCTLHQRIDIHVSLVGLGTKHFEFFACFFFYLFPLRFPKSWHTCYNGTLEVSLPIVFDLQCLIDPCCCILIRLFFHEELWRLFLALNAMGCFDMCYAISWSIWNNNTPKQQLNISFCLCYFKIVWVGCGNLCIIYRSMPIWFISIMVSM